MTRVAIVVAATLLSGVWAGAAGAAELHASLGNVSATVTWIAADGGRSARGVHLTIDRAGVRALDEDVTIDGRETLDVPVGLRVVDLVADGEPEVTLDLFTGGAHC